MDSFDKAYWIGIIVGLLTGFLLGVLIMGLSQSPIDITQETADEICQQLSQELDIEFHATTLNGKLICERPSFDNTQQIIFKEAEG